jgi:hypothetical protein
MEQKKHGYCFGVFGLSWQYVETCFDLWVMRLNCDGLLCHCLKRNLTSFFSGCSSFLKHWQTAQHRVLKVKLMIVFIHLPEHKALMQLNHDEVMTQHT